MTATLSPVRLMSPSAMRFGVWRPLLGLIPGGASSSAVPDWLAEWSLQRSSSLKTRQMLGAYALLSALSLIIAAGFWYAGVSLVWSLAGVELVVVGLAVLFYMRHAADRDLIAMKSSLVRVEQYRAGRMQRIDFNPRWIRVEPDQHDGSLIRLSGQGRSVVVGEFVPRDSRPQLAEEFRWALKHLDD